MATDPDVVEVRRRGINPILIVLVIVLAFVALFLLVIRPLFFGGEPEEFEEPPPVQTAPSPAAPPAEESPPEETFEVFESKDPFRPLVVAADAGAAGAGTAPATTTGGTTTTSPTPGTSTTGGTAPSGPGAAGGSAPSGGQRVQLMDVFEENGEPRAQVKVGSTVYTVSIDETFAGSYKLVSVSGNCATFLHGDDKFTLCEGEEVIK